MGSVFELVGPESACCGWVRLQVWFPAYTTIYILTLWSIILNAVMSNKSSDYILWTSETTIYLHELNIHKHIFQPCHSFLTPRAPSVSITLQILMIYTWIGDTVISEVGVYSWKCLLPTLSLKNICISFSIIFVGACQYSTSLTDTKRTDQ